MTIPRFDYDQAAAPAVRVVGAVQQDDYRSSDLIYTTASGVRRAAELFMPNGAGPFAAILYVHWLEDSPNANRSQFVDEASRMARRGAASLLIETMWSDRDWFIKRTQADDVENSVRQVVELRQAMDLLLAQPGIDAERFAYVGHDFGAMYGIVMGSVDPRPTCYALMAGTPRFSDWYLYYPKLDGDARAAYIREVDPLDPINHIANLSPAPLLFQFGRDDPHVPEEPATTFYAAAREPKQVRWYDAGHGLDEHATSERIAWLAEQLRLAND